MQLFIIIATVRAGLIIIVTVRVFLIIISSLISAFALQCDDDNQN